jgi:hypothetical protein
VLLVVVDTEYAGGSLLALGQRLSRRAPLDQPLQAVPERQLPAQPLPAQLSHDVEGRYEWHDLTADFGGVHRAVALEAGVEAAAG